MIADLTQSYILITAQIQSSKRKIKLNSFITDQAQFLIHQYFIPVFCDENRIFPSSVYTFHPSYRSSWNSTTTKYPPISLRHLAENGIATCRFDFCGSVSFSRSNGSMLNMSVKTGSADMKTILDMILLDELIDKERIYLSDNRSANMYLPSWAFKNRIRLKLCFSSALHLSFRISRISTSVGNPPK